jgi:hypothetical protein
MEKIGYTHDGVIIFEFQNNEITICSYSSDELTEENIVQQTACFIKWLLQEFPQYNQTEFGNVLFKIKR